MHLYGQMEILSINLILLILQLYGGMYQQAELRSLVSHTILGRGQNTSVTYHSQGIKGKKSHRESTQSLVEFKKIKIKVPVPSVSEKEMDP